MKTNWTHARTEKRWMPAIMIGTIWCAMAGLTAYGAATNRYVATDAPSPGYPFDSWAKAGSNIIDVANAANANNAGDIIYVSNGTYYLTNQIVVGKTVLTNVSGNRDTVIINGNYPNRCFYLTNTSAKISGFTIVNGSTVTNGAWLGLGGGVYMTDGTIQNCCIMSNTSRYLIGNWRGGGGVYMVAGNLLDSEIKANTAIGFVEIYAGPQHGGGGVLSYGLISNCNIYANVATNACAGGVFSRGSIKNCGISNNAAYPATATYGGGGVATFRVTIIEKTTIINNTCRGSGGGILLNDVITYPGPLKIRNCIIANNSATSDGGGVYAISGMGSNLEGLANCTIVSNVAARGGGFHFTGSSTTSVVNSIVYYNTSTNQTDQNVFDANAPNNYYTIIQSCVASGTVPFVIANVVTSPPQFVAVNAGNYRLSGSSPCIDAGINRNWMTNAVDLDGKSRIRYGVVDIGAYECLHNGTIFSTH